MFDMVPRQIPQLPPMNPQGLQVSRAPSKATVCERCGVKKKAKSFRVNGKVCGYCLNQDREALHREIKKTEEQKQVDASRKRRKRSKKKIKSRNVRSCGKQNEGNTYESRDGILKRIGYLSYAKYLSSRLWKKIRQKVYALKGNACSLCGDKASELHHNRYAKEDLTGKCLDHIHPICNECHESIEFENGQKNSLVEARKKFNERILSPAS